LDPERFAGAEGVDLLAGNRVPEGADPIAMAYAGHQFGNFVPQLGDGRAILLGELETSAGQRFDLQLKGAGRTPFSRNGDGRAAIGPVLREYIVSEAMHALGVPTTRSLAAVATGEPVYREETLPGAVLTRIASSHIRVGTFQYFAARQDELALRLLADHVIERHYPDIEGQDEPYLRLLEAVIERQAQLVARWMQIGFIHGVMNTDNMTVSGETIDYGPCAFMDHYHPKTVYSSIDMMGRYAFINQPRIAQWNLAQLAQCLLPLLDEQEDAAFKKAEQAVAGYTERYDRALVGGMRAKLGFVMERAGDLSLVEDLLSLMTQHRADYTLTFRHLANLLHTPVETGSAVKAVGQAEDGQPGDPLRTLFQHASAFDDWLERWRLRLHEEERPVAEAVSAMRSVNPVYIPRNHLVEQALNAAEAGDLQPFEQLLGIVTRPYEEQPGKELFAAPPKPHEVVQQTFCGT
jgi:uncharacterized protein YdiU (UPF0061 family)